MDLDIRAPNGTLPGACLGATCTSNIDESLPVFNVQNITCYGTYVKEPGVYVPCGEEGTTSQVDQASLTDQWKYARYTDWFLCAALAVGMVMHLTYSVSIWARRRRPGSKIQAARYFRRPLALLRLFSYPRPRIPMTDSYRLAPLGPILLVSSCAIFMATYAFAIRPDDWIVYLGTSPIGLRSGHLAIGMLPFLVVMASKVNPVTMLTGVSHEKLQVYHQYGTWIFVFLSVVHSIAFVYQVLSDDGWAFYYKTYVYYWSGIAMLVALGALSLLSLRPIRRRFYECFYVVHIVSAVLFLVFTYVHCDYELTSWNYVFVTVGIYGASILVRWFLIAYRNRLSYLRATTTILPEKALSLRIPAPTTMRWGPGQHLFLRFPTLNPFQSHPFSIANVPQTHDNNTEIHILLRPAKGLTSKAYAFAERHPERTLPVMIDGPYGPTNHSFRCYDSALLIGGGTGVTAMVPLLLDLVQAWQDGTEMRCKEVDFVWVVKKEVSYSWFDSVLSAAISEAPPGALRIHMFVTQEGDWTTDASPDKPLLQSKEDVSESPPDEKVSESYTSKIIWTYGRPELSTFIFERAYEEDTGGSLAVGVCGPGTFTADVADAVTALQLDIVKGRIGLDEVFLHSEEFSW